MNLNFYLFRESITDFDQAINQEKAQGENAFALLRQNQDLPYPCRAYFQKNKSSVPKWLSFFTDYFDFNIAEIINLSNSLIFLLNVENRIFAITSGFGYTAINKVDIEHDFGLRVVLNEIDPEKIGKIDSRTIDTTPKQKMVLLNRDSPLNEFDFDIQKEIISQMAGKPGDEYFGRSFSGSDSLKLVSEITLPELADKCRLLLDLYNRDTYLANFAFIDNLKVVKGPMLLAELDNLLIDAIRAREILNLGIAYPDINYFGIIDKWKIFQGRNELFVDEVDINSVFNFLNNQNNQDLDLKKVTLIGINNNNQEVTEKFSLYDCLVFETDHHGNKYVYSLDKWFKINTDFFNDIQQSIERIAEIIDPNFLPQMIFGESEGDYNSRSARVRGYLLLDKVNFPAGGYDKIEVSDLLTDELQFVCVKKYNSSSTLSHLFNQGVVSAELLSGDTIYRQFIHDKVPQKWQNSIEIDILDKTTISFIYAIATSKAGRVIDSLPFFSKVTLKNAAKSFEQLGIAMRLYKIGIKFL